MTMKSIPNTIAQTFLQIKGFYSGPVDGIWGPLSAAAAQAWLNSIKTAAPAALAAPAAIAPADPGDALLISPGHWYTPASRQPISGGSPMAAVLFLVIHDTCGATGQSSIDMWRTKADGVCAHFVIERNGVVIQCRPSNLTCGHAGVSKWRDPESGDMAYNINYCSIGIELANASADPAALSWARRQPGFRSITAIHPNGGPNREWECYYPAQVAAVEKLAAALIERYGIRSVVGHEQIAPERRDDPGPAFPWEEFRKAIHFRA